MSNFCDCLLKIANKVVSISWSPNEVANAFPEPAGIGTTGICKTRLQSERLKRPLKQHHYDSA